MKISLRYKRKALLYKKFASDWESVLNFDNKSLEECFMWETHGKPTNKNNGYVVGKSWLDVNLAMWREDLKLGLLELEELEEYQVLI